MFLVPAVVWRHCATPSCGCAMQQATQRPMHYDTYV